MVACQQKSGRQCGAYAKTCVLTYYPDSSVNKAPVLCSNVAGEARGLISNKPVFVDGLTEKEKVTMLHRFLSFLQTSSEKATTTV